MRFNRHLLALVVGGGSAILLALWLGLPREERLIELRAPPRPEPTLSRGMTPPPLDGLRPVTGLSSTQARAERNRVARLWHDALDALARGEIEIYTVEREEVRLELLRASVGEISEQELHARLAYLLGRDLARLELLGEAGLAGPASLERTRVTLERERFLAGLAPGPHAPEGYEALRAAYLQRASTMLDSMVENGARTHEQARDERQRLELEFPTTVAGSPSAR